MQIFECEQNSPEWYQARMGLPTASEFSTLLASGKGGGESKMRTTYMYKLAGEIITGELMTNYTNAAMERGKAMEDEARKLYAFLHDAEPQRVGFIANGPKGCSPDSLIGVNGMIEIKTTEPHLLIALLLRDEFPPQHKAQCQGGLWVAERDWIDLVVYWPKMPLFVKRAYRDQAYIRGLEDAVEIFNAELAAVVEKIKIMGCTPVQEAA